MDQREANREAKRAALFLLPVDVPMPDGVDNDDARRLREGWSRMRAQLAADGKALAIVAQEVPGQLAAWALAELVGPLCDEHESPIAQVVWSRESTPRWERLRFACGCEQEAPDGAAQRVHDADEAAREWREGAPLPSVG